VGVYRGRSRSVQGGEAGGGSRRRGGWGWLGTAGRQRAESEKWLGTAGRQRAESEKWLGTAGRQRAESEQWLGTTGRQRVERREQRVRSRAPRVLWKMVYGNFFRKPFSSFSFAFLRSNTNVFRLTFILRRNKRLQMLKTFYGKRFQPKQTKPK
jgi:hypothetical protein